MEKVKQRKAQVFTIDSLIGAFVIGIIILAVLVNVSKRSDAADIQTEKIGYDVVALLDYEGYLAALNSSLIERRMNETLPAQYGMRLRLEGNFDSIEVGDPILQRFVASGKRAFVNASEEQYGVATFWIWIE